jgi:hypothetical protein
VSSWTLGWYIGVAHRNSGRIEGDTLASYRKSKRFIGDCRESGELWLPGFSGPGRNLATSHLTKLSTKYGKSYDLREFFNRYRAQSSFWLKSLCLDLRSTLCKRVGYSGPTGLPRFIWIVFPPPRRLRKDANTRERSCFVEYKKWLCINLISITVPHNNPNSIKSSWSVLSYIPEVHVGTGMYKLPLGLAPSSLRM